MKHIIILILVLNFGLLYGQKSDSLPIELYQNGKKIEGSFSIYLFNKDTIFMSSVENLKPKFLNDYSIRICYGKHRILVPQREDEVLYVHVFLDKRSYKKILNETSLGIGNIFKKYYYLDLGLDVMLKVSRSKKKYCPCQKE